MQDPALSCGSGGVIIVASSGGSWRSAPGGASAIGRRRSDRARRLPRRDSGSEIGRDERHDRRRPRRGLGGGEGRLRNAPPGGSAAASGDGEGRGRPSGSGWSGERTASSGRQNRASLVPTGGRVRGAPAAGPRPARGAGRRRGVEVSSSSRTRAVRCRRCPCRTIQSEADARPHQHDVAGPPGMLGQVAASSLPATPRCRRTRGSRGLR